MSGTAISQLPAALSALPTDLVPVVEIGTPNVTKRITISQLMANTVPPTGGVFNGVVEFDQGILLDNNQYLQWRDTAGTPQNVMALDNSNNVVLRTYGTEFALENSAGTSVLSIDTSGNQTAAGTLALGNTLGINYSLGHWHSFSWDGLFVNAYVDGGNVGQLATVSWVQGGFPTYSYAASNYKPASSYTPNQNVDINQSPTFGAVWASEVRVSDTVTASNGIWMPDPNGMGFVISGGTRYFQCQTGWVWAFNESTGDLTWQAGHNLIHNGDFGIAGNNAFKPGGGSWAVPSDPRIKSGTAPYTKGLADLGLLQPIVYQYTGNEAQTERATGREFVGLDAAATEPVWPSLVLTGDTVIDGQPVNDLKLIDANEVTWAMVNGIQELVRRVETLETRLAELMGRA